MNITRFTFYILLATSFWIVGCTTPKPTPDPLAGWKFLFHQDREKLNKAIREDYQNFIQDLPPQERDYVGDISLFENGTGQHAVSIEIFSNKVSALWRYALIYDKENKRIKLIKYGYSRYQS